MDEYTEYTRSLLKLTQREGQVMALVAKGKTTSEIADELHLNIRTVENHPNRH